MMFLSPRDISIPSILEKKSSIRGGRPRFQTLRCRDPIHGDEKSIEPVGFPSKMKTRDVSSEGKSFPLFTTGYASSGNRRVSMRAASRG